MNNKTLRAPALHSRGITLVEILLVLGVLVIILSFAMPSVSSAVSKTELKATAENVQYSLRVARKTARLTESAVSVHISSPDQGAAQTITVSSPDKHLAGSNLQNQDYTLPPEILLISDHDSFYFDEKGLVEKPGRILLLSKLDEELTTTIYVD